MKKEDKNKLKEEFDLISYLRDKDVKVRKSRYSFVFCSPFREDKNPSCSAKQYSNGWFVKDFATGEVFDALAVIQRLENCNFTDALNFMSKYSGHYVSEEENRIPNYSRQSTESSPNNNLSKYQVMRKELGSNPALSSM